MIRSCSYLLIILMSLTLSFAYSDTDAVTVSAHEARSLVGAGHHYLDVRMAEDFERGHVEGALNIPFYSSVTPDGRVKNPQFVELVSAILGKDDLFIVGCRTGVRSKRATTDLLTAGFKNVKNIGGGYLAWVESLGDEKEANI